MGYKVIAHIRLREVEEPTKIHITVRRYTHPDTHPNLSMAIASANSPEELKVLSNTLADWSDGEPIM